MSLARSDRTASWYSAMADEADYLDDERPERCDHGIALDDICEDCDEEEDDDDEYDYHDGPLS